MLTESIINLFKNKITPNILDEELHLPHGTKSAKVICHVDLDGVVSGISMVQQLVKQGIPKERISVEFAQYGDDEKQKKLGQKEASKFQPKNKHQWVGVTDYAKYPKCKFWEVQNKLMSFHGDKQAFVSFANSRDWSKVANVEDFKHVYEKTFHPKETKFTEKSIDEMYDGLKAYSNWGKKDVGEMTVENVEKYSCAVVKPDFGSDHHSNEDGALSKSQRGEVAVNSPSEAEFFANKYAPGMWGQDDLKAVSMVDSAGYTEEELKNTIFLEKHFTGPNRKRCLANIISVVYDSLCKKDEKVAKWVILNSQPSLVSLYTTVKQGCKLNGERLRMLEAIKNGDMKTGGEIAAALPKILKKNWTNVEGDNYKDRNGGAIKKAATREGWSEKNQFDLENAKTGRKNRADEKAIADAKQKVEDAKKGVKGVLKHDINYMNAYGSLKKIQNIVDGKKGKIFFHNNFTFFDGGDKKTQYGRFMTSLMSNKGMRSPYALRFWSPSMFQISLNTLYKQAFPAGTELLDLSVINTHVLNDLKNWLVQHGIPSFTADKITADMKEKNGGHKSAIWTWSGFDKIKPTSKEQGGESYWKHKEMVDRANAIVQKRRGETTPAYGAKKTKNASEIVPNAARHVGIVDGTVGVKYKELAKQAFEFAINSAVYWTNKLYPPKEEGMEKLKNSDKRFEMDEK